MIGIFKRLNRVISFSTWGFFMVLTLLVGCKKKERLTASTFNFTISPPAATLLQSESVTLKGHGGSAAGPVDVNPTWSLSGPGTLNTDIGPTVIMQPTGLGDVIVSATADGITATSRFAIVTVKPSSATVTSNTFNIYDDFGLPTGNDVSSDIFKACASQVEIEESSIGYAPEGIKYQHTAGATVGDFWGVTLDKPTVSGLPCGVVAPTAGKTKDLSAFSSGALHFALRLSRSLGISESLNIALTDSSKTVTFTLVSGVDGFNRLDLGWQEISLSLSTRFPGIDYAHVKVPFSIAVQSVSQLLDFDVDAVRWEK